MFQPLVNDLKCSLVSHVTPREHLVEMVQYLLGLVTVTVYSYGRTFYGKLTGTVHTVTVQSMDLTNLQRYGTGHETVIRPGYTVIRKFKISM